MILLIFSGNTPIQISGYIEAWGRGTIKIIEKCKEAGLPTPLYYYESSGFWVEFRKDIYNESYLQTLNLNDRQDEGSQQVTLNNRN